MQSTQTLTPNPAKNIYLDDTIQTIRFQKDALEVKFKHNINQLASKNVMMSKMLREVVVEEREKLVLECDAFKKMVDVCISMQDSLNNLDALEMKTQILKAQVLRIRDQFVEGSSGTQ